MSEREWKCVRCGERVPSGDLVCQCQGVAPSVREERAGETDTRGLRDRLRSALPLRGAGNPAVAELAELCYDALEVLNALAARAEPVAAGTSATPVKCGGRWRTRIVGRSWGEWEHTDRQHVYESILRSHGFTSAGLEHEHVQFWMFPDAHPVPVAAGEPSEAERILDYLSRGCFQLDYDEDEATVDRIHGNVNDRQWTEEGRGDTMREALRRAALGARKGGG